jgi:hypothetical protein
VPNGDTIAMDFGQGQQPEGQANEPGLEADPTDDAKSTEIARLKSYAKKGKHIKRPFTSDILTPYEIALITAEEVGTAQDAPFWEGYP